MLNCENFSRLRLQLRLRDRITVLSLAPAPAPDKKYRQLQLRAKCSTPRLPPQIKITSYTFFAASRPKQWGVLPPGMGRLVPRVGQNAPLASTLKIVSDERVKQKMKK